MILQALCDAADVLASDGEGPIPRYGFRRAEIAFAIDVSDTGRLIRIVDLRAGEKRCGEQQEIPFQARRSGTAPMPYFLCDRSEYVLGLEWIRARDVRGRVARESGVEMILAEGERGRTVVSRRSRGCFTAFRTLHHALLDASPEPAARAILAFLDAWDPASAGDCPAIRKHGEDLLSGGRIAFMVGDAYLHQVPAIREIWAASSSRGDRDARVAQCLICGSVEPIARTHPALRGIPGALPWGAALVSFNADAFRSYGKEQCYNASVCDACAFTYATVLNRLLASPDRRVRIGDTTALLWAQTGDRDAEAILRDLLEPPVRGPEPGPVRDALRRVDDADPETPCCILGLAPTAGRFSVRFWYRESFGTLAANLVQHHLDLEIERRGSESDLLPISRLLLETVHPKAERQPPPPGLAGHLMRSVLSGSPYPFQLFTASLNRVRTGYDLNRVRAGIIKAYLLRSARSGSGGIGKELIPVRLEETNPSVPYRLGRLFAVLERVKSDANRCRTAGRATRYTYFGTASARPAAVFPGLLGPARHHIAEAGRGPELARAMEEIMAGIDVFPIRLGLEEEGMFMLGYYHQSRALSRKEGGGSGEVTSDE
jgi:CRISPR-associated protein Csd1